MKNKRSCSQNTLTRRRFLRHGMAGMVATGLGTRLFLREAAAAPTGKRLLVCLFQRGAVDGLNMVVPFGDPNYGSTRPDIAIGAPSQADGALNLDGFFGLHPAMESLMPAWSDRSLAIIHACGSPDPTRSHFDAQDYMETGTPGVKGSPDGWLNRHLQSTSGDADLRGIAVTNTTPRILAGEAASYAASTLTSLDLGRGTDGTLVRQAIDEMYVGRGDLLGTTVGETLANYEIFTELGAQGYAPQNGAAYPNSSLGRSLQEIAQVRRADIGLEVAFVETGGWDTHSRQGAATGNLADLLADVADSLGAFYQDLGKEMDEICLLTMSEFGRTVAQNGSGGTDHGRGTAMMAIGGTVNGGQVLADWPGLAPGDLSSGRDLAVTTDFRDLCGEIVRDHLGNPSLDTVFPDHVFKAPGIIRT
ncbi:MAG: DUF1501 domain-containing protein [Candidatus Binatia bacterium]|nr:DUF1501 domain-containing protein [Candidatus Binatia bacterium]